MIGHWRFVLSTPSINNATLSNVMVYMPTLLSNAYKFIITPSSGGII